MAGDAIVQHARSGIAPHKRNVSRMSNDGVDELAERLQAGNPDDAEHHVQRAEIAYEREIASWAP